MRLTWRPGRGSERASHPIYIYIYKQQHATSILGERLLVVCLDVE